MRAKYRNFSVLQITFFSSKFVGTVFVSLSYDPISSSCKITESSIVLAKYFPFSKQRLLGFQV